MHDKRIKRCVFRGSTTGDLVFTADSQGNMLGLDARTGKTLWHPYGGRAAQNGPITYELDGRQYVIYGASGVLYAFALPESFDRESAEFRRRIQETCRVISVKEALRVPADARIIKGAEIGVSTGVGLRCSAFLHANVRKLRGSWKIFRDQLVRKT